MDESSPVYENFMNKMSTMGSRPKINRTTFNIGANVLEKRVANNSRKITIIKSILKNQKIDIGEKLTTPEPDKQTEVSKELASINSTLVSIGNILSTDFANRIAIEKGQNKLLKDQQQKRRRAAAESGVETVKKIGKGLGKITSPIREGGSNILKALSLLGLGVAGNLAFDFLKSDFGQEKIGEFFSFLKDNWKWMLGTIIGVGGALALGGIISGISGIGLALKALGVGKILPLIALGGLFAAGYYIPKIFPDTVRTETDKKIDKLVEEKGVDQVVKDLKKEQENENKLIGAITGTSRERAEQIYRIQTGKTPEYGFFGAVDPELRKLIKEQNKKPKITEITLPIEELYGRERKQKSVSLSETTDVPYVTSINVENEYMEKIPKIHGIKL